MTKSSKITKLLVSLVLSVIITLAAFDVINRVTAGVMSHAPRFTGTNSIMQSIITALVFWFVFFIVPKIWKIKKANNI